MTTLRKDIDSDIYRKDFQWKEGGLTVTRTTQWSAPGCHNGCQVLFYTNDDGDLVKVEGDPNGPFNKGRLCMRCLDLAEAVASLEGGCSQQGIDLRSPLENVQAALRCSYVAAIFK